MTKENRIILKNSYVFLAKFLNGFDHKNPNVKRNLISFVGAVSSLKPERTTLNDWFEGWLKHRPPRSILDFHPIKFSDDIYVQPIEQVESFDYEIAKISLAYIRAVPIKKRRKILLRIDQLMKDFGISNKWIGFVVAYLMFRWVSPGNLTVKRNVSIQSFTALMEYEMFFWAHYFPNADDKLKNAQKRNTIHGSSQIYDYTLKPIVEKNINKPAKELEKLVKDNLRPIIIARRNSGEKTTLLSKFLNDFTVKDRLSDADVVRKLYPDLRRKKQIKQKADQMKKIRERIKNIEIP